MKYNQIQSIKIKVFIFYTLASYICSFLIRIGNPDCKARHRFLTKKNMNPDCGSISKIKKCISSWLFMVINFPAMTFKMFPKNIFFCRSDIYKCKDFLFFSLPLKSTTEHECTLNFRKFLKIPTTIGSKVTSCVDNSFWNVFIPLISDLLCGQHNKLPYNRIINIVELITQTYYIHW